MSAKYCLPNQVVCRDEANRSRRLGDRRQGEDAEWMDTLKGREGQVRRVRDAVVQTAAGLMQQPVAKMVRLDI